MESSTTAGSASSITTYTLTDFSSLPELQVPSLCEIWNWQGDTSVLPYKVNRDSYLRECQTQNLIVV